MGPKSCVTSQTRCGAIAAAPTAIVTHGAADLKYAARRESSTAARPRPASRKIDQYFPSMASAAHRPASPAQPMLRRSNERRKQKVAAAHNGIKIVLAFIFKAKKLKKGTSMRSASASTRF